MPNVNVTTVPVVGVAVPVVSDTVPPIESQTKLVLHVGVPGLVPAPAPAAKVAVPAPATDGMVTAGS